MWPLVLAPYILLMLPVFNILLRLILCGFIWINYCIRGCLPQLPQILSWKWYFAFFAYLEHLSLHCSFASLPRDSFSKHEHQNHGRLFTSKLTNWLSACFNSNGLDEDYNIVVTTLSYGSYLLQAKLIHCEQLFEFTKIKVLLPFNIKPLLPTLSLLLMLVIMFIRKVIIIASRTIGVLIMEEQE